MACGVGDGVRWTRCGEWKFYLHVKRYTGPPPFALEYTLHLEDFRRMAQDSSRSPSAASPKLDEQQQQLELLQKQKQREAFDQFWSAFVSDDCAPRQPASVLTSEVYNEAELLFTMLENKEKLISFLDCTTVLRGMGMNPTGPDMDVLRSMMAEPVMRLEQWRREEEMKRDAEKLKEGLRDRKRSMGGAKNRSQSGSRPSSSSIAADGTRASIAGFSGLSTAMAEQQRLIKVSPAEEIKNIDWNIFISCVETVYRDRFVEQGEVVASLRVFDPLGKGKMTIDEFIHYVTTNGDSVLTPLEVKALRDALPEECSLEEFAARIQGTYVPPTQAELDRLAAEAEDRAAAERAALQAAASDPLSLV